MTNLEPWLLFLGWLTLALWVARQTDREIR